MGASREESVLKTSIFRRAPSYLPDSCINQDSAYPKGRFSRSTRVYEGSGFYDGGIVWALDGLSNRDEVPNNELRLRRVDANTEQRLLETACQTSVAGSRSTHH